jgi:hypothetical protein
MRKYVGVLTLVSFDCARGGPPADAGIVRHLPGNNGAFTLEQIHADYGPADWYPGDHPPMPDIVAHGKEAIGLRACALCHYANGRNEAAIRAAFWAVDRKFGRVYCVGPARQLHVARRDRAGVRRELGRKK